MYESPATQEEYANVTLEILVGSNIGEGGEGQEGDVKENKWDVWTDD